jgi:stress response protein YsnF
VLNQPVDAAPAVREEDGVLIVPVLEEQIVVQKRLILKEELRITRGSHVEVARQPVRLKSERAQVERVKTSGSDTTDLDNQGTDHE